MITLNPAKLKQNGFLVKTANYPARPKGADIALVQWIEEQVITQSTDFLINPRYWILEWEKLTGSYIPEQHIKSLPKKITSLVHGGRGEGIVGYEWDYLPVLNDAGKEISYPSERLVQDFVDMGLKFYILDDSILKKASAAR